MTSTVRTLAELPQSMTAGEGGVQYEVITAASAALKGVAAVQSTLSSAVSAKVGVGGSFYEESEHIETGTVVTSSIQAGHDVSLDADQDVTISAGQIGATEDVTIKAGQDVTIQSETGGYSRDFSSIGIRGTPYLFLDF